MPHDNDLARSKMNVSRTMKNNKNTKNNIYFFEFSNAGCVSLSRRIDGWNRVRNRHKFGDENLIRFKALSRLASHAN